MSADLVQRLIEAGTPAALVAEVAMVLGRAEAERSILAQRRENERNRKSRSRDITGQHVTERDGADPLSLQVSPQTPLPKPIPSFPPIVPPIDEQNTSEPSSDERLTPDEILAEWNELAEQCGLAKAGKMTGGRLRQARARLREYPELNAWQRAFGHIRETPFLCGKNDRGWRADLDFLLQAKSFAKLTEGSYGQA